MSIIFEKTIAAACIEWLGSNSNLSAITRTNYNGEVDRFGQYLAAKFGLMDVRELQAEHWQKYLSAMRKTRKQIANRRSHVLKASSAIQAMRITRQFLIWCASQGLIAWWPPRVAMPVEDVEVKKQSLELPDSVRLALTGKVLINSLEDARAVLAINLAYWGALELGNLTRLKVAHLSLTPTPMLLSATDGREVHLPGHLPRLWNQYRRLRERDDVELSNTSPLISHLNTEAPVRPWAIWSMVKDWQNRNQVAKHVSPQELRARFIASVLSVQGSDLAATATHAGNSLCKVQAAADDTGLRIRRIQRQELMRLAA